MLIAAAADIRLEKPVTAWTSDWAVGNVGNVLIGSVACATTIAGSAKIAAEASVDTI
jgi:hypothetical protein